MSVILATDRLTQLLASTPAAYADMAEALHGTRAGMDGERVTGGGGDDRPMPLQVGVVEHRHQLVHDLRFWTAQVAGLAVDLIGTVGHSVPRMCAVLIHAVPHLEADDREALTDTLADWHSGTRHMSDLPKLRTSIPLPANTCPGGVTDVWECPGALRVMVPADRGVAAWLQCAACKARYSVTDLPEAANVRLPLSVLSELTGTPVRTLQYRVQRELLPAEGGLARLGDVLRSELVES